MAASNSSSRTFRLYHIFPAVLAIAFHDWKIWDDLVDVGVFPINIKSHPLAVLLIYIDTWDDYKRKGDNTITINNIIFEDQKVTAQITWHNQERYLHEKFKYENFKEKVIFDEISLIIDITNDK